MAGQLPDADGNGVPDPFEGKGVADLLSSQATTSTTFVVDGQTYDSVASLPPEIRERLRGLIPETDGAPSAATPDLPLAEGEILLNGVPTRHEAPVEKKRWWQRLSS